MSSLNETRQRLFAPVALSLLVSVSTFGIAQAQQTNEQQSCINTVNKAAAKLSDTYGKLVVSCVKTASTKGGSAAACVSADAKNKVASAAGKVTDASTSRCGGVGLPDFGFVDTATTIAAAQEERGLIFSDLLGGLDLGTVAASDDKAGAKCQQGVMKALDKLAKIKLKTFVKCKKSGLAGKLGAPFGTALELETCFDVLIADAVDGKTAKAIAKLGKTIGTKCDGATAGTAFPGSCAAEIGDLAGCMDREVECRVCRMLNLADGLAYDCDFFDDGLTNGSCASTTPTTTSTTMPGLPNGSACSVAGECASGYCANGYCCDEGGSSAACCASAGDCLLPSCDGLVLTSPVCSDNSCDSVVESCDDANPCTDDACSVLGCQNVDNSFQESCYEGPVGTQDVGVCSAGVRTCSGGSFGACDGQTLPALEDACGNGLDDDCDGLTDEDIQDEAFYPDVDGDGYGDAAGAIFSCPATAPAGYITQDGDCNDNDSAFNPGAPELCNGQDNDCNGFVDDGTLYPDADADGYGNDLFGLPSCSAPAGWVLPQGGDCNDGDPAINIGASEVCGNGIDDDCDGTVDEGCGP